MPTSSIFVNVKISDPEKVEAFVNALEASANEPKRKLSEPIISSITDLDAIRNLMEKRIDT